MIVICPAFTGPPGTAARRAGVRGIRFGTPFRGSEVDPRAMTQPQDRYATSNLREVPEMLTVVALRDPPIEPHRHLPRSPYVEAAGGCSWHRRRAENRPAVRRSWRSWSSGQVVGHHLVVRLALPDLPGRLVRRLPGTAHHPHQHALDAKRQPRLAELNASQSRRPDRQATLTKLTPPPMWGNDGVAEPSGRIR